MIRPIHKNLLVKLVENKPKSELQLPPEYETSNTLAEVVDVSRGLPTVDILKLGIDIGTKIIFTPGTGVKLPDSEDELIINIKDIIAIVEGN